MKLSEFIEQIYRFGLEKFRRYYGPYKAIVVSNKDPQAKGRIQIHCPRARLGADNLIWVNPMMDGAGSNKGVFWPPDPGDGVWVFFDNGDPVRPSCYMGGWYGGEQQTELNQAIAPDASGKPVKKGFITPGTQNADGSWAGGHQIILDDTSGSQQITIQHTNGMQIIITNDSLSIGSKDGEFQPIPLGTNLVQWLTTHVHPTPMGPSGPPAEPPPETVLSSDTKTT